MSAQQTQPAVAELERLQRELQQREREILELAYVRRADGIERVRDAIRRLGELGSPSGILARAGHELGAASQFDRIMISEVHDGQLLPRTRWDREGEPKPPARPVALEYPLVEHDAYRSRRAQLVGVQEAGPRASAALTAALHWAEYIVAPIVVESEVIGLMHCDATASGRKLDEVDREIATIACTGLGEVFDRAVLRETLQRHRAELQSAATWITGRLRATAADSRAGIAGRGEGVDRDAVDALTPREREILVLMARGQTNAAIAEALVVREGTVKYHVKNVLRKLGARSRADAVARYARATGVTPR